MARMSVDDMLSRDPRLLRLAALTGWSRREVAGCLVLDVWPLCYDRMSCLLDPKDVDAAAGLEGFADHMTTVGLAKKIGGARNRIRISGAEERIEYLHKRSAAGRAGGLKSAEARRNKVNDRSTTVQAVVKQSSTSAQRLGNPPDPVPDMVMVPDPVIKKDPARSASPPAKAGTPHPAAEVMRVFNARWLESTPDGVKYAMAKGEAVNLTRLVKASGEGEVLKRIARLFDGRGPGWLRMPYTVGTLVSQWNALAADADRSQGKPGPFSALAEMDKTLDWINATEAKGLEGGIG